MRKHSINNRERENEIQNQIELAVQHSILFKNVSYNNQTHLKAIDWSLMAPTGLLQSCSQNRSNALEIFLGSDKSSSLICFHRTNKTTRTFQLVSLKLKKWWWENEVVVEWWPRLFSWRVVCEPSSLIYARSLKIFKKQKKGFFFYSLRYVIGSLTSEWEGGRKNWLEYI